MITIIKKYISPSRLAAAVMLLVWDIKDALAETQNIGDMFGTMTEQSSGVPSLIAVAAYISGIGFTIAGLLKLKEYVDTPDRAFMKDALIRLAGGACLILLPWFISTIQATMGAETDTLVEFPTLYQ